MALLGVLAVLIILMFCTFGPFFAKPIVAASYIGCNAFGGGMEGYPRPQSFQFGRPHTAMHFCQAQRAMTEEQQQMSKKAKQQRSKKAEEQLRGADE